MPVHAFLGTATPANTALDYRLLTPGDANSWVPNPLLDRLFDLWRARRGGKTLPARSAFSIDDLKPWLGRIAVAELEGWPPRFRFVLHGMQLVENMGEDWTGRYLDEVVPPAIRDVIMRPYLDCVAHCVPVFDTLSDDTLPRAFAPADRLVLPCAEDGTHIDRTFTCVLLNRQLKTNPAAAVAD